jgi:hypothetical protein
MTLKNSFLILILLSSWACQNEPEESEEKEASQIVKEPVKKIEKVIEDKDLSAKLGFPKEFFQLENTRNFGSFHNDHLNIYLTKDAELNGFKSDDVALFFLNDRLVRIRYSLEQDIMEKLVDSLDLKPANRGTLKKITMRLADRNILYRRATDSIENRNHYYLYEELPEYKKMIWGAEVFDYKN